MRILLTVPTAGQPAAPFLDSLRSLQLPPTTTAFDRLTVTGNFIPGQRELAARRALALGADVLVMLDDDMIVPPHAMVALCGLLESDPTLGLAGALYYSRDGIAPMATDRWEAHDTTLATVPAFGDGVTYCDGVGFGCVVIRVNALRTLTAPYFEVQAYVEEGAARVRLCNEDYLLCRRLRRTQWRIALHAGVRCGHYDRVTAVAQPREWESAATTQTERMIVVDPGPHYRLAPYDPAAGRVRERHETSTIDYVIVD